MNISTNLCDTTLTIVEFYYISFIYWIKETKPQTCFRNNMLLLQIYIQLNILKNSVNPRTREEKE